MIWTTITFVFSKTHLRGPKTFLENLNAKPKIYRLQRSHHMLPIFLYSLKYYCIIKITWTYRIKEIYINCMMQKHCKTLSLLRSLAFDDFPLKPMLLVISSPLSVMKNIFITDFVYLQFEKIKKTFSWMKYKHMPCIRSIYHFSDVRF